LLTAPQVTAEICWRLSWEVLDRLIIFVEVLCHIFKREVPFGILGLKNNKFKNGLQELEDVT
jgi:hypothetical protein